MATSKKEEKSKKIEKKETTPKKTTKKVPEVKDRVKKEKEVTKDKVVKEEKKKNETIESKKKNSTKVKKKETEENLEKTTLFVTEDFKKEQEKLDKEQERREKEQEKAAKKERRRERRREIWKEVRAFLILFVSIGLVCFGVYYWYTHYYNKDDKGVKYEKVEKQIAEYKTVKYSLMNEQDYLTVVNDKYLIERDDTKIYKIMDLKSNVLFEGEETITNIYEGTNGNIYITRESGLSFENIVELYELKEGKFEKTKTLSDVSVIFNPIVYKDDEGKEKLVGFAGLYTGVNETLETTSETEIYTIDGEEYNLEKYYIVGDNESKKEKDTIITYDDKYLIFYEIVNNKKKYGIYNIKEQKVVIEPQYDGLHTNNLNYIAIKNGKAGIISSKLKKIVDFQFDFIDRQDGYYIVCKNNKMAIMNEDYKLVTDFIYDYQASDKNIDYSYYLDKDYINTFASAKINDKYILSTNNGEDKGYRYDKHNTFIINSNGSYETVATSKFVVSPNSSLIYAYDEQNKKYTIYDQDIKELYKIDLSEYDYTGYPEIELVNENTIIVHINSDIYFNYETGEEIDKPLDYQTTINGVTISYDNKTKKVEYRVNNDVVATIMVNISEDNVYFNKLSDNILYYNTTKDYVYIEKGE